MPVRAEAAARCHTNRRERTMVNACHNVDGDARINCRGVLRPVYARIFIVRVNIYAESAPRFTRTTDAVPRASESERTSWVPSTREEFALRCKDTCSTRSHASVMIVKVSRRKLVPVSAKWFEVVRYFSSADSRLLSLLLESYERATLCNIGSQYIYIYRWLRFK